MKINDVIYYVLLIDCLCLCLTFLVYKFSRSRKLVFLTTAFPVIMLSILVIHSYSKKLDEVSNLEEMIISSHLPNNTYYDNNDTIIGEEIFNMTDIQSTCKVDSIVKFLGKYDHLSDNTKSLYANMIITSADNHKIDPFDLASIIDAESRYQLWEKHKDVYVRVPLDKDYNKSKMMKTNAVGLSGIIYEIWKYKLADKGINQKEDLYFPSVNIEASAIIFKHMMDMGNINKYTAAESGILRYYGVIKDESGNVNEVYLNKINKVKNKLNKYYSECIR